VCVCVILGLERTVWLGFEIVAERCIIARVIRCFEACEIEEKDKCTV
jgi:hypothetical protein